MKQIQYLLSHERLIQLTVLTTVYLKDAFKRWSSNVSHIDRNSSNKCSMVGDSFSGCYAFQKWRRSWCAVVVSILAPDRNAARNGRPAFAELKRVGIKRFCPQNFPQTNPSVLLIIMLRHMRMPGGGDASPYTCIWREGDYETVWPCSLSRNSSKMKIQVEDEDLYNPGLKCRIASVLMAIVRGYGKGGEGNGEWWRVLPWGCT